MGDVIVLLMAPADRPRTEDAQRDVLDALRTVADRALDEPIAAHDFVTSVAVGDDGDLEVHLRLPRSCARRSLACLVASDARDVLTDLPWSGRVAVVLDDHWDAVGINEGLAADARSARGHVGVPGPAGRCRSFRVDAHAAAAERCLSALRRHQPWSDLVPPGDVVLGDLLPGRHLAALLRRRRALGLPNHPTALVLVDADGVPSP